MRDLDSGSEEWSRRFGGFLSYSPEQCFTQTNGQQLILEESFFFWANFTELVSPTAHEFLNLHGRAVDSGTAAEGKASQAHI